MTLINSKRTVGRNSKISAVSPQTGPGSAVWLKSYEVRKLLNISAGTLQNLRINGTLPYNKIGGLMYYRYDDIQKLMDGAGNSK